ncbi:hypothetical protein L7F22_013154 [Adiantum nelumboides]|nr:hypothetical protein [Adiantum nelumboides]
MQALFKSKHLQAIEGLDMNIKNIEAELHVVRQKQQNDAAEGAQTDARKPLEVAGDQAEEIAGYQAEEDRILANLYNDDLEDDDDDDDDDEDDGLFSWGSDSLDEDELSDVDEVKPEAAKMMHEEKIVKPVSWTSKDSAPVKGKKKRMTAKELILAEQELFRNRRQAETAQKTGSILMQSRKPNETNVDKCLLTDDEDNIAEKGDGISENDVLLKDGNKSEATTSGKVHSGIKNKKIAKFMEDFESDSEEEDLGPAFDGLDDLDQDEADPTTNKESNLSDDEK